MEYTIDATNKSLGRIASEAAVCLRGKRDPDFQRHIKPKVSVHITNASKLDITKKKEREKIYKRYSGYPGGLKEISMKEMIEKKGREEVLKKAIFGMLPNNKLRSEIMKNLKVSL